MLVNVKVPSAVGVHLKLLDAFMSKDNVLFVKTVPRDAFATKILPAESKRNPSAPPSTRAIVSAAGKNIPVLVSPVVVIAGADTVPAENVATPLADKVVNAPVLAVVAPTVPLILIDAVPVKLVTVPLLGVPNAPPLTTKAPAVPVLTPKAVTTPVPVVIVEGANPAPPPITRELAANTEDDVHVDVLEK